MVTGKAVLEKLSWKITGIKERLEKSSELSLYSNLSNVKYEKKRILEIYFPTANCREMQAYTY
jgi:hypothetical protein